MNNEIQVINKTEILGHEIQIFGDFESPMFLAKDVAEWIEHSNTSKMLKSIDEEEKITMVCEITNSYTTSTARKTQEMLFLTEDGLYEVLMQSRKPIAKDFKKQIKTMLKAMRKGEAKLVPTKDEEKAQLLLSIYNGGQDGIVASKMLTDMEVKEKTAPLIATIEEQKPEVEFATRVQEDNQKTYSLAEATKVLKLGGRNKVMANLRDEKILRSTNEPYQSYIDRGYFILKISDLGHRRVTTTRVTGKGLKYLEKIREKIVA